MTIAQSIARTINAVSMRAAKHNNAISRQHAEREKNFGKSMQLKIQLINKDLNKKLSTATRCIGQHLQLLHTRIGTGCTTNP